MAQLAIKGHATRGREVIELLEMLGGMNVDGYDGHGTYRYYIIRDNDIDWCHECYPCEHFISYTLEEFLEKFPYKVGDDVVYRGSKCQIVEMKWDDDKISYLTDFCGCWQAYSKDLQPYKEETMEGKLISKEEMSLRIDTSQMKKRQIIFSVDAPDETELVLGDNFEIKVEDGKTYVVRKKPQYPKTYEECLEILGYNVFHTIPMNHGHQGILMMRFQKLLIFRDAYWKIAGEQMGLGNPWEPDWESDKDIYTIEGYSGTIDKDITCHFHRILAFPTVEMLDAFYENFKELIESCKELL